MIILRIGPDDELCSQIFSYQIAGADEKGAFVVVHYIEIGLSLKVDFSRGWPKRHWVAKRAGYSQHHAGSVGERKAGPLSGRSNRHSHSRLSKSEPWSNGAHGVYYKGSRP